ncbi:15251_t:CDS:2 [Acaulospora colombiana]|uniref:15251_t:CDS:1 n=1 Tax=Acaulospora colombiana TaxID=27376 RepID=A0ACA9P1C0_9GLOM|nr:15251_t:CDS:2 [Acaulospora colombiana]
MNNIFRKVREKSSSSRPSTPPPQVDRAIESATQILAAVGSPHPIFQRPTSDISPRVDDPPLSPGLVNVTPSNQHAQRNFWKEAIESLANEYICDDWPPKEWKDLEHDGRGLLDVVVNAKNRCLKSQWTIQISGRTINLRDCFTKIVDWVQMFAVVGDAAVQFDTAHAALPWAGFRFLLQVNYDDSSDCLIEIDF